MTCAEWTIWYTWMASRPEYRAPASISVVTTCIHTYHVIYTCMYKNIVYETKCCIPYLIYNTAYCIGLSYMIHVIRVLPWCSGGRPGAAACWRSTGRWWAPPRRGRSRSTAGSPGDEPIDEHCRVYTSRISIIVISVLYKHVMEVVYRKYSKDINFNI